MSPAASESAWLRRVSLDLSGRLPLPEEVTEFLADSSDNKREQVVDRLLSSDGYVDLWTLRFSRLLRMHSLPNETQPLETYSNWLRDAIRTDRGLDQLARELLTATGDSRRRRTGEFWTHGAGCEDSCGTGRAGFRWHSSRLRELSQSSAGSMDSGRLSRARSRLRAAGSRT